MQKRLAMFKLWLHCTVNLGHTPGFDGCWFEGDDRCTDTKARCMRCGRVFWEMPPEQIDDRRRMKAKANKS